MKLRDFWLIDSSKNGQPLTQKKIEVDLTRITRQIVDSSGSPVTFATLSVSKHDAVIHHTAKQKSLYLFYKVILVDCIVTKKDRANSEPRDS